MSTCALCNSDKPLKESHIIPSFVYSRIKHNSPTGYLRGGIANPNIRRQDGDRQKLLCGECEQRFSKAERKFAEEIFEPYHETGQTSFVYEEWLSYFICSVNWRTLHLDNIQFHSKNTWKKNVLSTLCDAEKILANFLLGHRSDISDIENHILPMFHITQTNSQLKKPNLAFRVSAFDYTFCDPSLNAYYICANLAGILILTIIRRGENDVWNNTKVYLNGGSINQPPDVSSSLMPDMMELLRRCTEPTMSQIQKDKIMKSIRSNPDAAHTKAIQYRNLDNDLL